MLLTDSLIQVQEKEWKDYHFSKESFFAKDSCYHPELGVSRNGVLGDPVPYRVSNDNTITALLLGCFILATISVSHSLSYILRQAKSFFYTPRSAANMTETTNEVRFQFFLMFQTALLLGIVYYLYVKAAHDYDFVTDSQLLLIGIFAATTLAYLLLKGILYNLVNWVFFPRKKNLQWNKAWLFLISLEGVVLFPLVLLLVYFDVNLSSAIISLLAVVLTVKILTFYKCYVIFFKRNRFILQIFLYFCALELMPVMALWGILDMICNYLRV